MAGAISLCKGERGRDAASNGDVSRNRAPSRISYYELRIAAGNHAGTGQEVARHDERSDHRCGFHTEVDGGHVKLAANVVLAPNAALMMTAEP